jgi:hypothetical protein
LFLQVLFENSPVGPNTVAEFLPKLAEALGMDRLLNRQIRPTGVQLLTLAGVDDRSIMTITGHKKIETLRFYDPVPTFQHKAAMAVAISSLGTVHISTIVRPDQAGGPVAGPSNSSNVQPVTMAGGPVAGPSNSSNVQPVTMAGPSISTIVQPVTMAGATPGPLTGPRIDEVVQIPSTMPGAITSVEELLRSRSNIQIQVTEEVRKSKEFAQFMAKNSNVTFNADDCLEMACVDHAQAKDHAQAEDHQQSVTLDQDQDQTEDHCLIETGRASINNLNQEIEQLSNRVSTKKRLGESDKENEAMAFFPPKKLRTEETRMERQELLLLNSQSLFHRLMGLQENLQKSALNRKYD